MNWKRRRKMQNTSVRVFGPKVFDPNLARQILGPPKDGDTEEEEEDIDDVAQCCGDRDGYLQSIDVPSKQQARKVKSGGEDDDESTGDLIKPQMGSDDYEFFHHMQEVMSHLSLERKQKDLCLSKLKEIESEFERFSQGFFQKLQDLRTKVNKVNSEKTKMMPS